MVVVVAPILDHHLCLGETGEHLDREQLVAYPAAEGLDIGVLPWRAGLDIGVLPWRAGLDVGAAGAGEPAPIPERIGGELWAVVTAHELRCPAPLGDQALELRDGGVRVDATLALDGQRLASELINDVQ
jgi:hypothetical protein